MDMHTQIQIYSLQKRQVCWPYVLHIHTVEIVVLKTLPVSGGCSTACTLNKPGKAVYVYDEFVNEGRSNFFKYIDAGKPVILEATSYRKHKENIMPCTSELLNQIPYILLWKN